MPKNLAALTNAVQVSLADADAVAWAGVTASVAPGSVSDPHSTAAVVGGSEGQNAGLGAAQNGAGAGVPLAAIAGAAAAVVMFAAAFFFYRTRRMQGKRELVYNAQSLPTDKRASSFEQANPLTAHGRNPSLDLTLTTSGGGKGAASL